MHTRNWDGLKIETGAADASNRKRKSEKLEAPPAKKTITAKAQSSAKGTISLAQKIIDEYDIDPYDYDDAVLKEAIILMFQHYDLFRLFSFEEATMRKFLTKVKGFYNPKNLFHNFKHIWGVVHLSFHILKRGGDKYLMPLDIFATMVAAICHDIQHPGNNNAFEAATGSDVSKAKQGVVGAGILECLHATITNRLLNASDPECDILAGLSEEQGDHFCRQVGLIILGTDMAKHASILAETRLLSIGSSTARSSKSDKLANSPKNGYFSHSEKKNKQSNNIKHHVPLKTSVSHKQIAYEDAAPLKPGGVDVTDAESRIAFTRLLVHTADIGAQTQSSEVALKWMQRCYGEFRSQARREEEIGIVTSPFLHSTSSSRKLSSHCGPR
jgi:hypothetical protein